MSDFCHWMYLALPAVLLAGAALAADSPRQPAVSDNRPLTLTSPAPDRVSVGRFQKIEFQFQLAGTYANAFDPDQIKVDGRFTTPSGQTITVPGFFFQDYDRHLENLRETLTAEGTPDWRIRFAPTETGTYSLVVIARDHSGKHVESQPVSFECVGSDNPGYIRRSPLDNRYFAFDNGSPYVPIGANVCWADPCGTFNYDAWLARYGAAECNYIRLWLAAKWGTFTLECIGEPADRYGAGKLDLSNAWRLDYVMGVAAKQHLYAMLCLNSFNELRLTKDGCYPIWDIATQNAANGGPLKTPREFWTNPTMLKIYRDKLRYVVARWGWDPNVFAWEFWNEVDIVSPSAYVPDEIKHWHVEMSDYLRSIDPWKHLQSTSFANSAGVPEIDRLAQMDFTQTHNYGSGDIVATLTDCQREKEAYGKPHYVGEFGVDASENQTDSKVDTGGISMHSGMWSSLLSGSAGSAMLWWWGGFIHGMDMYHHFTAIAHFIHGIDFPRQSFEHVKDASFISLEPGDVPFRDLEFLGPVSWEASPANRPTTIEIDSNGRVKMSNDVAGILFSVASHPKLYNPLTLELHLPHQTRLHVLVRGVSSCGGAHLSVSLDGKTMVDKDMPNTNSITEHDTIHEHSGDYTIDIPGGEHVVKVDNIGADWIMVRYLLERAKRPAGPELRLFGLRGKDVSLIWIQNSLNTWSRSYVLKRDPDPQPPTMLTIPSWPAGEYTVRFWDTYTGSETGNERLKVGADGLSLKLPAISKDIALRIEKAGRS